MQPQALRHECLISIHALREEGDGVIVTPRWWTLYFYPRPPRGGRPRHLIVRLYRKPISIHALREEGDPSHGAHFASVILFLFTPSARRATPPGLGDRLVSSLFLSTPSARRATCYLW